ncbi:MAG: PDGLE domain-containing protein [Candidatus Omnitrophica bacterium]|nr:PDGLE domain-containing protein [Candidatus Omnitrophota bacterium]MDD5573668.1 PDGLE domain-containing protein [Candidatus Omnitrophota bacterium]
MKTREIIFGILAALVLAVFLSPFASEHPDGLERVAEDHGFIERGEGEPAVDAPVPDYVVPGVKNEKMATALAGALGVVIVFAAGYGAARLLVRSAKSGRAQKRG